MNLRQNPRFLPGKLHCPALQRGALLWTKAKRRLATPLEHVEIQGYDAFGEGEDSDEAKQEWVTMLRSLSAVRQRSIDGNGMHAAAVGAALMFVLSGTEGL